MIERAYAQRPVTLASGRTSNFYIDSKQVTLDAEGATLVGRCLHRAIQAYEAQSGRRMAAVGGLTLGADPIATAISVASFLAGDPRPAFLVRKEPKGHGTQRFLEGIDRVPEGTEVAVLEDVVTTGGSALRAAERVRAEGRVARVVFALVDRQEGGREALAAADLELVPLFARTDFPIDG
jgi:orotate phosphoribosyltransferase